ncbi:MAG: response regulator [Bacteroidales bacterium]|jgi:signal transduction histidine kinase|nr:response regulator [Bacteroidales bacterium]
MDEKDFIELKQELEDKLQKAEKKYNTLVNALFPNFIFVFDIDFNFVEIITPEGLRLFHNNEELIGTSGRLFYSPEVSELFVFNIRECLENGHLKEIEYHLDLFGTRYFYQARLVPVEGNKVMCLIQDIGDRVRRMEELIAQRRRAEEADRMKSNFLANMSHEIRTPLNAIIGFAGFVASEMNPAKRSKYMDVIRHSSDLLLQVVNDILDLSRLEAGVNDVRFEETDVNALVKEIRKIHQPNMKPEVALHLSCPTGTIRAFTDGNRVKQILFNLLSNAIKNTETGSITLKVAEEGDHLRFSVIDTGRGIPEDKLRVIFNRFEKLDGFAQGTGLGLSICENLVKLLGGEIRVESQLGHGSTFSFTLPYRNVPDRREDFKIGSVKELVSQKHRRILVAEDSDTEFNTVKAALEKRYEVVRAVNGEEALKSFIREKPDIILMDIQMPVLNGIEATRKIRAISSSVPIIAVTTNDFYIEQRMAYESGCNDVISKPYSPSKIEEVVLAFIG